VSFLEKARQAAEQAKQAAQQAAVAARPAAAQAKVAATQAGQQAKQAAGAAGRGLATIVERIDPSLLAELVIKATALQEKANASLYQKGSPYRVSEIVVTATIPPQISFSIARLGDDHLSGLELDSMQLLAQRAAEAQARAEDESPVLSLDGSDFLPTPREPAQPAEYRAHPREFWCCEHAGNLVE